MNRRLTKKACAMISMVSVIVMLIAGLFYVTGARINTSKSIPVGLYWITKHAIEKGQYVLFCPPENPVFKKAFTRGYFSSGFCPGGFGYLMKRVLATHGDTVSINQKGVWVNHQFVAHSVPYPKDAQGRALPEARLHHYKLKDTELLLMTDRSETSFDARYFGVVTRSQVKAVIRPLLCWPLIS